VPEPDAGVLLPPLSDEPQVLCDAYIACVGKAVPQNLDNILAAYSINGSCWKSQDKDFCRNACVAGIAQLHKNHDFTECGGPHKLDQKRIQLRWNLLG
jgi:hypothetical protein